MSLEEITNRPVIYVTDFGPDSAKGRMKAALEEQRRKHNQGAARVLDEVHSIPSFQILAGSFEIGEEADGWSFEKPVIVGVVDPGVGTERRPIALETKNGIHFVGPDNGLSHHLVQKFGIASAVRLNPNHRRVSKERSATFDGRDLFGVQAGKLTAGIPLSDLGDLIDPTTISKLDIAEGTIMYIDTVSGLAKFQDIHTQSRRRLHQLLQEGNAHTLFNSITIDRSKRTELKPFDEERMPVSDVYFGRTFGETKPGDVLVYPGSSFTPELAVNMRNTRETLNLGIGDRIEIHEI